MVFSSVIFIFFFLPVVLAIHFIVRMRLRDSVLLCASAAFYFIGEPRYWPVLVGSLILNYVAGLVIGAVPPQRRFPIVTFAVVANLSVLFAFKYADFALGGLAEASGFGNALRGIALPLGISFFTFHGISYVVDVYRGTCIAQRSLVRFGLYFLFFPQLIAGPIIRYHFLADQFRRRRPKWPDVHEGLTRFGAGLAKKVVIANPLGAVADAMFAIPSHEIDFVSAWLGAIAYALQIYFDFSGYSDMAIGLARMFGLRFPENFNYPYIAKSITEFWRRWHISLSLWFRDYVYISLGGNRHGRARTYLNLVTVFLLCGLWHGAGATFLIWGLYFGAFLVLERALAGQGTSVPVPLQHGYALLVILIGWVIFRSPDLGVAADMLRAMATPTLRSGHIHALYNLESGTIWIFALGVLFSTPLPGRIAQFGQVLPFPPIVREYAWAGTMVATLLVSLSFVVANSYSPFIYFRF